MSLAFVDRPPSQAELERFRLILSTYQDGSGMLSGDNGRTLPGWRDFERSFAAAFGGTNQEDKSIFDVLIPKTHDPRIKYGVSCKMKKALRMTKIKGRVYIELSNAHGDFVKALNAIGLLKADYSASPDIVGPTLIRLIEQWKQYVNIEKGGEIDLTKSCYLSMQWDKASGSYQLFQFSAELPLPKTITWSWSEPRRRRDGTLSRGHLNGDISTGCLYQWFDQSGGQMKYFPEVSSARWISPVFQLESIPDDSPFALSAKAKAYFLEKWNSVAP